MRTGADQIMPRARTSDLIVRELPDEVLVYDTQRLKALCLNQTSAFIWKRCDGKMTVAKMTRLLGREFSAPVDEDVVWLALRQLRRLRLLDDESVANGFIKVTRRDLVRKYLPAALAIPLILSIPAPAAAQAGSTPCAGQGQACSEEVPCCPGFNCDGICFPN